MVHTMKKGELGWAQGHVTARSAAREEKERC